MRRIGPRAPSRQAELAEGGQSVVWRLHVLLIAEAEHDLSRTIWATRLRRLGCSLGQQSFASPLIGNEGKQSATSAQGPSGGRAVAQRLHGACPAAVRRCGRDPVLRGAGPAIAVEDQAAPGAVVLCCQGGVAQTPIGNSHRGSLARTGFMRTSLGVAHIAEGQSPPAGQVHSRNGPLTHGGIGHCGTLAPDPYIAAQHAKACLPASITPFRSRPRGPDQTPCRFSTCPRSPLPARGPRCGGRCGARARP